MNRQQKRDQHPAVMNEQQHLAEILRTYAGADTPASKLTLGTLGLAGEVVDLVKKHVFQGHVLDRERLLDELGDLLWYFLLLCHAMGYSLESVMACNVKKLHQRYPGGFASERSINRELSRE